MQQLASKYNHHEVEKDKYREWIVAGYFKAGDISKVPYAIVIPPPNVTGKLHLGHAWDNTLQDIMARYKRLKGYDVLYLPGMDHAGIATQAKIDEKLREQGTSRYDLGREKFLDVAWQWKDDYATIIRQQWEKLGVSLDYSRERFTLDDGLSKAVTKVFIQLYNEGLIYQGKRIINWDPKAMTALSNIEVIHKEVEGKFYTFGYTVVETGEVLHVATTRPETMFGDVCLVVHPEDSRYTHVVGCHAINPANQEVIPIITDDYIDMEFGTGVMKCTPAHDPNDFVIGEKYHLEKPICMNPDGTMNELAGKYVGQDRFECRDNLVKDIEASGHLVSIEKHVHQVGHSERTDVVVEPYLSKQWFVKMKPLAEDVLSHQDGDDPIRFIPERFEKTFKQWLENIEDWCISRQLWWGHRIPAWFNEATEAVYVGESAPDEEGWVQDEDVLDTWFSSALWPFSTLGWPDDTADFERYYPTAFLSTGYDIIFFWVARMAFQARHFTQSVPFRDCLIHGLIRDESGRKMSKSLGNGIDPMAVIDEYGVDALRFFLIGNSAPGQDLRYSPTKVEAAWNFINKIWNATRFIMLNYDESKDDIKPIETVSLNVIDQWILQRFNATLEEVNQNIENFEFPNVTQALQKFVWDDFCSWYIELSKTSLQSNSLQARQATLSTLFHLIKQIALMLHPFMPFVTEEIYQKLPTTQGSICVGNWPETAPVTSMDLSQVNLMIASIEAIRTLRVDYGLKPSLILSVRIKDRNDHAIQWGEAVKEMLERFGRVVVTDAIGVIINKPIQNGSVDFNQDELIDQDKLKQKNEKELKRLQQEILRSETMLANPGFTQKAPSEKVALEQAKLDEYKRQYELLVKQA